MLFRSGLALRITLEQVEKEITVPQGQRQVERRAQDMIAVILQRQGGARGSADGQQVYGGPEIRRPWEQILGDKEREAADSGAEPLELKRKASEQEWDKEREATKLAEPSEPERMELAEPENNPAKER